MSPTLDVVRDGPVTVVALDRPERRNAVDPSTATALHEAFSAFDDDPTTAVAVLTGRGGTFCAGADLQALAAGATPGHHRRARADGPDPDGAVQAGHRRRGGIRGGRRVGAGHLVRPPGRAEDASFGVFCRRFGVPLIDGGTVRLPRLIGQGRALDLILTGREVGATEALAMGLVNRVVPTGTALDAAIALAHELAALPQACLRNDRRSTLTQWGLATDEAMVNEIRFGLDSLASPDAASGPARFASGAGRGGSTVDPAG